jgi:hypothetical protein
MAGQLKMLLQCEFNSTMTNAKKRDECDVAVLFCLELSETLTEVWQCQ